MPYRNEALARDAREQARPRSERKKTPTAPPLNRTAIAATFAAVALVIGVVALGLSPTSPPPSTRVASARAAPATDGAGSNGPFGGLGAAGGLGALGGLGGPGTARRSAGPGQRGYPASPTLAR